MLTSLVASTKAVASKAATYNGPPNAGNKQLTIPIFTRDSIPSEQIPLT